MNKDDGSPSSDAKYFNLTPPRAPDKDGFKDLTGDGGVLKKVTQAGTEGQGAIANAGDKVQVNYIGSNAANGVEFDRNLGGYPYEFVLGEGKVIKGWDVAFREMTVGEKAELVVSAAYGYGSEGSPGASKAETIPPGASLKFILEFVGIKRAENPLLTRAEEDRARLVELRALREKDQAEAKAAKEAKEKSKADAAARLAEKAAAKGKKGKGGGGGYVKKEKEVKPQKIKKGGGPKRAEKQAQDESEKADFAEASLVEAEAETDKENGVVGAVADDWDQ